MPKNPHQRPQPIQRNHSVPRHGLAQPPAPAKQPAKKTPPPIAAMPALDTLLARDGRKT